MLSDIQLRIFRFVLMDKLDYTYLENAALLILVCKHFSTVLEIMSLERFMLKMKLNQDVFKHELFEALMYFCKLLLGK